MTTLVDHIQRLPQRGEKTAVLYQTLFRTFRWSYRELYLDVQKAASFLDKLGVGRGDRVVIWAPNSPQWVILLLSTLYRGAVVVPADVGATTEFVRKIAEETEARVVFRSRLREDPGVEVPTFLVEELLDDIQPLAPHLSPAAVTERDLAEILYTSGTTGTPKGVMLTHGNIAADIKGMEEAIDITPDHLLVSILPLSHVFEQSACFWAGLTHGATLVYLQVLKPSELFRALKRYPVTVLVVVPQVLGLFRSRILRQVGDGLPGKAFRALLGLSDRLPWRVRRMLFYPVHAQIGRHFRFFVVGGAPLDVELERFWARMGFVVLQGYGLTETSPVVSVNRLEARKLGSVGLPLPGVEVDIAPDGEVLVRGETVTPGYFKDPLRTAEAFTDGWLRTGDLGYLDSDGFLFLKGRKKDMIVTPAGLNVYPEDVEGVFLHLPGVRDVAVLEFQGKIHAVLLLEPGADPRALVEQGNAQLAGYQRVQGYTVWPEEDFPRTTTRKPKKHEIKVQLERMARGEQPAAPRPVEPRRYSQVVAIVAQLSGKPPGAVVPEARLGLDLGLDSVARIELVGMLEERLNTEVAEEALSDETTVRDLEGLVAQGRAERRRGFPRWALSLPARVAREAIQRGLLYPIYDRFVRQSAQGLEYLDKVEGPVVFAPNHSSHLDILAMVKALPPRFRGRLATAQLAEFFEAPRHRLDLRLFKGLLFLFVTLAFNTYPLPRTRGFRQSLQYTGELLDRGWNVLVFPEGELTYTGEIGPFREGVGVLAGEMRVPVVPVYIEGMYQVLPRYRLMPRRGRVTVRFGQPMRFHKESYVGFTRRLESEVRRLAQTH